jgi:hypothetical protein
MRILSDTYCKHSMIKTRDLNLLYSGGSGGFLLLHLLLLSGRYFSSFPTDLSLDEIIERQWQIKDPARWKEKEMCPSNTETKNTACDLEKIYFYCNPDYADIDQYPGHVNLCLYTNYASQLKLAYYKKANWFYNSDFVSYKSLLRSWQQHYRNVKDPSWPDCNSFRKIKNLPAPIQKELLDDPHTHYYLNYESKNTPKYQFENLSDLTFEHRTELYQGDAVYKPILPFILSADVRIKLQDLVNSNAEILPDLLDIPKINSRQKNLLDHWRSLHCPQLLRDIGIQA